MGYIYEEQLAKMGVERLAQIQRVIVKMLQHSGAVRQGHALREIMASGVVPLSQWEVRAAFDYLVQHQRVKVLITRSWDNDIFHLSE